jgi:glycolate oxidase FAD binding subunit
LSAISIHGALLDYSGIVEYYAQELVMTVKAGTPISEIKKQLKKNNLKRKKKHYDLG